MNKKELKKKVLKAFQKVSPSRIDIENDKLFERYIENHHNLFFSKLKFPPELFKNKRILDFGCGTGEVDVVLAGWGGIVEGFDFNPLSIDRANKLKERFDIGDRLSFFVGDIDDNKDENENFDIVVSFGVIAHVSNPKKMFERMNQCLLPGGYLILGYVEEAGLIQRLMHRAIVWINSNEDDAKIMKIAKACFPEHIERSVRIGGRAASSVINDYLVNPLYNGLSTKELIKWGDVFGLQFYSSWPTIELPFVVDSPYLNSIEKSSEVYQYYISLNRLRWIFAQAEDGVVFSGLIRNISDLEFQIEDFIELLTTMLQNEEYTEEALSECRKRLDRVVDGLETAGKHVIDTVRNNLMNLGDELLRVLSLIVDKAENGKNFDLNQINGLLFRGYNGLGTSYAIWRKPT